MKGVVFTEFMEFVGGIHGADMLDDIIDDAALPHGGAYTSVGTYPFQEMQRLLVALCRRTNLGAADFLKDFGRHLCDRFLAKFPEFFRSSSNLFDFLESVDTYIHVEVHKLYSDAELPRFRTKSRREKQLEIDYTSCRPLEALAEGMILGAASHYRQPVDIMSIRMNGAEPFTRFLIKHAA